MEFRTSREPVAGVDIGEAKAAFDDKVRLDEIGYL